MTLKLIIGNKAYSSWSLRGWLAAKQSGLHFEEVLVPLFDQDWEQRKRQPDLAPSAGKVPTLWDGEAVIWDSLAIIDYLADKVGRDRYWLRRCWSISDQWRSDGRCVKGDRD
mgnify:CR=1 FL=1